MNGEVGLTASRIGGEKYGIVDGPTLVGIKPSALIKEEFTLDFQVVTRGGSFQRQSVEAINKLIESFPADLIPAMQNGFSELVAQSEGLKADRRSVQSREDQLKQETRRLMEEVDAQKKLNDQLREQIENTRRAEEVFHKAKENWRTRIERYVSLRTETIRSERSLEIATLKKQLKEAVEKHEKLRSSLRVLGKVLEGGDE